jgi:hypothetical protein
VPQGSFYLANVNQLSLEWQGVCDGDGAVMHPRVLDAPQADKALRLARFGMRYSQSVNFIYHLSLSLLGANIITVCSNF